METLCAIDLKAHFQLLFLDEQLLALWIS